MMRSWMIAASVAFAALPGLARAEPGEVYQFGLVPGTANLNQVLIRVNIASGQTVMCPTGMACIPVTDAKPLPAGAYRALSWAMTDATLGNRPWNILRVDARSGRMWTLAYDGKVTASWTEYTLP